MLFKDEWAAIRTALGCPLDVSVALMVVRVRADPSASPLARAVADTMWTSLPGEVAGDIVRRAACVAQRAMLLDVLRARQTFLECITRDIIIQEVHADMRAIQQRRTRLGEPS